MLDPSQKICKLYNVNRLSLYAVTQDGSAIVSKVKSGLNSNRDVKIPINTQSIAGYVAMSSKMINIVDVNDALALEKFTLS